MRRTPPCFSLLLFVCVVCIACGTTPIDEDFQGSTSAESTKTVTIDGAKTGAMERETTPAGFVGIATTVTVPDFDSSAGAPWIYFGFGDEASSDMEIGLAFQPGDGTATYPHRYLPYTRFGKTFWFADEATRVMPGDTVSLDARLSAGKVTLERNGQPVTFWARHCGGALQACSGLAIDGMAMPTLTPAVTHVRRVVGLATASAYAGQPLGELGPVVFRNTTLVASDGTTVPFDSVKPWSEIQNGVLLGSASYPSNQVQKLSTTDANVEVDTITLFPAVTPPP